MVAPPILDDVRPYSVFSSLDWSEALASKPTTSSIPPLTYAFSDSTTGFEVRKGGAKAVDYPRFPAETEEAYSSRRLISEMACAYEHDFKSLETQSQVQMCSRCGGVTTYA